MTQQLVGIQATAQTTVTNLWAMYSVSKGNSNTQVIL
jgi:hypothetical protein